MHRLHVLQVSSERAGAAMHESLFTYCHYADDDHDPHLEVAGEHEQVILRCRDSFKLKPNVMRRPANRVDIYMPGVAAASLALDIIELAGAGGIAELAGVDPEAARQGRMALPIIRETRNVDCTSVSSLFAGCRVEGRRSTMYIDNEAPHAGHIEMQGPEVHLGIPLRNVTGPMDVAAVRNPHLWNSGSRLAPTTDGDVTIRLSLPAASSLAAVLLSYSRAHEMEAAAFQR